ncbi:MAG: VPLPA-CTERM sorting domain-containing protein [Gammaproteobacteria bacterium]|nr:VPLPA-CTERM sorting domain-containing protein [Gammaproteobacteria bacterium]
MTKTHTTRKFLTLQAIVFSCIAAMMFISSATAATVDYTLDNIMQNNGEQLTGTFQWTYTEDDFENGEGLFTELYIPGYGSDITGLTINFDIAKSIEFSLTANLHSLGVNVSLFLLDPLTPTTSAFIDTSRSTYEVESGARRGGFVSGSITPIVVPLPASLWLFISGLVGLSFARRQKTILTYKKASLFK